MKAGGLALSNLIQPIISLEMPVPSQESALSFICVLGLSNLTLSTILSFYCNLILHFNERNLISLLQKCYINVTLLHHWNN